MIACKVVKLVYDSAVVQLSDSTERVYTYFIHKPIDDCMQCLENISYMFKLLIILLVFFKGISEYRRVFGAKIYWSSLEISLAIKLKFQTWNTFLRFLVWTSSWATCGKFLLAKNGKCYEHQIYFNLFIFEKRLKNFMFLPFIIFEIFTISQFDISNFQ